MGDPAAIASDRRAEGLSRDRVLALLGFVLGTGILYRLVGQHVLPPAVQVVANLAVAVAVVVVLARWGVLPLHLGLLRRHAVRGVSVGMAIILVAGLVIGVGLLVPETRAMLGAGAGAVASGSSVLWSGVALHLYATFGILLATALPEELLFRGALHGLLRERLRLWLAIGVNGLLFGLWHIPSALGWLGGTASAAAAGGFGLVGQLALTVLFTGLAGVGLTLLRHWTNSLAAPVLAHWGVNAAALLGASAAATLLA